MLKAAPTGATSFRASPIQNMPPQRTPPASMNYYPRSRTVQGFGSSTDGWEAYANGGVQADDELARQARREEEARYHERIQNSIPIPGSLSSASKLIEDTPEKLAPSRNTDLLLDFNVDDGPGRFQTARSMGSSSYATAASSGTAKSKAAQVVNLLD